MKLLIAVVHNHYRQAMEKALGEKGYRMTEMSSTGSFRRRGNTTFLIGIGEGDEDTLKAFMKDICLQEEAGKGRPKYVSSRFVVFSMDAGNGQLFTNLTQP